MSGLRILRWRAAVTAAGAIFVLAWLLISGLGPGYLIQIDYAWTGELLEGAEVVVDGEVVGKLKRRQGGQPVVGFRVRKGEHEVLIRTEDCEGSPRTVRLSPREGRRVLLLADLDESYRCRIILW